MFWWWFRTIVEMLIVIVKCIYNWYKIYLILVAYFGRYSIHESLRCDRVRKDLAAHPKYELPHSNHEDLDARGVHQGAKGYQD